MADVVNVPCSGEVLLELVERACHHSVGEVECFLDTIAMVDIYINVEDTLVGSVYFVIRCFLLFVNYLSNSRIASTQSLT